MYELLELFFFSFFLNAKSSTWTFSHVLSRTVETNLPAHTCNVG